MTNHLHQTRSLPQQMQELIRHAAIQALSGRFHAHITIAASSDEMETLQAFCRAAKAKLTVIDLENLAGRSQQDVMTTQYFADDEAEAVTRIVARLTQTATLFQEVGFDVVRAKLEHESLPSLPEFDVNHYHEVHIKLLIPATDYPAARKILSGLGQQHGFVPSRNPLDRSDQSVTQFVNLRIYDGDITAADTRVHDLQQCLARAGFQVQETKRETVVFDTHQQHDRWWI